MILAAFDDGLYRLLFLGHMLSFLVAFAPAVINPILVARLKSQEDFGTLGRMAGHMSTMGKQIHFPALIALGGFGIAMVLQSDPAFAFDQTWVSLAFLVWLAIIGVIGGVVLPSERKLAEGDSDAERKVAVGGQIATVLALVMLYLMIWKPGL